MTADQTKPLPFYPPPSNLWDLAGAHIRGEFVLPWKSLSESWLDSWMVNCSRLLAKVQAAFPTVSSRGKSWGGGLDGISLSGGVWGEEGAVGMDRHQRHASPLHGCQHASCPPLAPHLTISLLLTIQSTIVFKTTAPPLHRVEAEGVVHTGVDFGSPAAARAINAAGRAVAHEAGILILDAEVRGRDR